MKTTRQVEVCQGCGVYEASFSLAVVKLKLELCDNCAVILRRESKRVAREMTERNTKRNREGRQTCRS